MRYAVVNSNPANGRYNFGKWHETEEEAIAESERLCENEPRLNFIVLKSIGYATVSRQPVTFIKEN